MSSRERKVSAMPLTILTDNLVWWCKAWAEEDRIAHLANTQMLTNGNIHQKRFGNWKTEGSEKQPGVRHIKADVTSERKQETNERRRWKKQMSWLRWDRVWTKAKSAEWLASVLEMDRDKKKTSIRRQPSSMMEVES